jgi:hypothetical protein
MAKKILTDYINLSSFQFSKFPKKKGSSPEIAHDRKIARIHCKI